MPVTPVLPSTAPETTAGTAAPPENGFESALAVRMRAPSSLPSVSLAHMVDALAGGSTPPAPGLGETPTEPTGPAQTASVGAAADAWGAASDRPGGVDGVGAKVLSAGERYLGVPYKWGGTSASQGFDCSGFVQQVYADLGIKLPRVSVDQAKAGTAVASMGEARAGDLVFWKGNGSRPNHIGIYAGEGRMLVAPRTGDVVKYQEIRRPPDGIRRVVA